MSANYTKKVAQLNDDQIQDNQDQSTTNQSKQSNNILSPLIFDSNCKTKSKKTQKSLLTLAPQIQQRNGSKSCIEQPQIYEQDSLIQKKNELYTIFWYDATIDHKYQLQIKASSEQTIGDLIKMTIEQFSEQNEYLETPFSTDARRLNLYELYIPKKKKGTPNEDFPSFAHETQLYKTNQIEFALKISTQHLPKYSSSLQHSKRQQEIRQSNINQTPKKKKNFFEKLFSCCSTGDY